MTWPKPVIFTARIGPNFLWHMLAVAKVGYDSDYADRHAATVCLDAVATLRRHASRLQFGNGKSGSMTALFAFLPAWLHLESSAEFAHYFQILDRCFREGSFSQLVTDFPAADWSDRFFCNIPGTCFPPKAEDQAILAELTAAYMANFDTYATLVWPTARVAMSGRAAELTAWFEQRDYIAAWEAMFGEVFAAPAYEINLCYSNSNGPDCNSLGYSGNLFYFAKPFERTWQFASHEIGTHLLYNVVSEAIREGRWRFDCLYRAYEVMVMFFNSRLLDIGELAYDLPPTYDHRGLLALYMDLSCKELPPADLLRRGAEYLEAKTAPTAP